MKFVSSQASRLWLPEAPKAPVKKRKLGPEWHVPELPDRKRAPEIPDNSPAQMCEDSSSTSSSSSSDSSWESGAPFAAEEEHMPEQPALF